MSAAHTQPSRASGGPLVVVRREARVAWLVINRPEVHNALSTATNHLLRASLEELDADPGVGCIVIRGAGERSFSAGADLREVTGKPGEQLQTEFDSIVDSIETIRTIGTPVIAVVHGYAFGGGLGLVAAADMAIASEDALFATPEITLGRFPLIISAAILRSVPEKKAFEMAFTGRRFTAAEARDMGLVNTVVPGRTCGTTPAVWPTRSRRTAPPCSGWASRPCTRPRTWSSGSRFGTCGTSSPSTR
ncbi:enoyl-CoA hydratase/isomerase family protein [Pseudonocardia sp. MH-G8]|uniref:enoyl-CoA hydratase/isomerase family protein n=1 Tax=Pseudonocardia sp. MH-G8 TaxID=1854588 RepID=UPI000BA12B7E|nr:enoyl-CoA hydratase/isomerase family protein [Pseudonocardia sp. MH-G8]OZM75748.1 enoyl-CoA hydratase [Pseudonocardia sp. MH-G8]